MTEDNTLPTIACQSNYNRSWRNGIDNFNMSRTELANTIKEVVGQLTSRPTTDWSKSRFGIDKQKN